MMSYNVIKPLFWIRQDQMRNFYDVTSFTKVSLENINRVCSRSVKEACKRAKKDVKFVKRQKVLV